MAGIAMTDRVWDGRGDALEDARLTTVDGRMADDGRLRLPHFKVMAHVGRQNGRRGWLRVSQTELAERWACHRNSINRAFVDLVAWGYLLQRTQHEAGESFCQYKIRLDGEDTTLPDVKPRPSRRRSDDDSGKQGECTPDCAPHCDGGAQHTVHMCTVAEYTCAHPESTPPVYRARAHRLSPTIADTPPLAPVGDAALEEGEATRSRAVGLATRGWASGWDHAARHAVLDLLSTDRAHVATALLLPLIGTLNPPQGVHGASWVRELADAIGKHSAEVLGLTAGALKAERVRDLPAVPAIVKLIRAAARNVAAGSAAQPRSDGGRRIDIDAWLAQLNAADAREPAVAVSRRLVGRLGPETTAAWFDGLAIERDGHRVELRLGSPFFASYVRQRFAGDVALAVAAEWPEVSERDITITDRSAAA